MGKIEDILRSGLRPKEKQTRLVEDVCNGDIASKDFFEFFQSASNADKGACADAMKHISERRPDILAPHIDVMIAHLNHRLPRVKWGIPEAIGNLAAHYPEEVAGSIPYLLKNTVENETNTTVIRWCAAYGICGIATHNPKVREELLPVIKDIAEREKNAGVRNVYVKTLKALEKTGKRR